MHDIAPNAAKFWMSVAARWMMFFALWAVLTLGRGSDLAIGVFAAMAACWVSVSLLPAGSAHPSLLPMLTFILHFFHQSVVAGLDVAKRAVDPRLPICPGYIQFPCSLSAGPTRSAFCAFSSLLPGTVPVKSDADGNILVHCLDTRQAVADQLREDVRLFRKAIGAAQIDG